MRGRQAGRWGRLATTLAAVALVMVVAVTVGAAPANAHPAAYSWDDNDTICTTCSVNDGNLVRMWQLILLSANATSDSCRTFADGNFGSRTAAATRTWQSQRGLGNDGIVGRNTWTKAASFLAFHVSQAGFDFYYYNGGRGTVWFRRAQSNGVWQFQAGFNSGCSDTVTWFRADH